MLSLLGSSAAKAGRGAASQSAAAAGRGVARRQAARRAGSDATARQPAGPAGERTPTPEELREWHRNLPFKWLKRGFYFGAVGTVVGLHYSGMFDIRDTGVYRRLARWATTYALGTMDPEEAHGYAIKGATMGLLPWYRPADWVILNQTLWGLRFQNPIGIAAGLDKQGEAIDPLLGCGFGFVEVGTVTPKPQPGNPKPRMFRLKEDAAVINRFGFNSDGLEAVHSRVEAFIERRRTQPETLYRPGVVGVNVGKNKDGDAVTDYVAGVTKMAPVADYLVINVSSPNTPGLRKLQGKEQLRSLLRAAVEARDALPWGGASAAVEAAQSPAAMQAVRARGVLPRPPPPLLVKIAPDMTDDDLRDVAEVALAEGVDGLVVSNTTIARPDTLHSEHKAQTGGLSGAPVRDRSTEVIRKVYQLTKGELPIVGVGGVASAADAYEKIKAGASLVQMYTALAYQGPGCVVDVSKGVAQLLWNDRYESVADAVGADVPEVPRLRKYRLDDEKGKGKFAKKKEEAPDKAEVAASLEGTVEEDK